jgi:AmmeMemoRadiSam system protein B
MKKSLFLFVLVFIITAISFSQYKTRKPVDTIGFASKPAQMDEFMKIAESQSGYTVNMPDVPVIEDLTGWKVTISPHDDYSYVGYLYPALLSRIKTKTVILIGVCHKAKLFNLENKIIFDSYSNWKMPYGDVPVSNLREEITSRLPVDSYIINDSIQALEHSVEAIVPFLQYYNRDVEIISILVPYMTYDKMNEITGPLAKAVFAAVNKKEMQWGKDFSIVISSDAVHYGDEDWGDKNFAFYGADTAGYLKAVSHEYEIIYGCLTDNVHTDKIKKFVDYTVDENNFKEYKWTWCGRYSVPFGLLTAYYLQDLYNIKLTGSLLQYATSLDHPHIPVTDLGMGVTAPANIHNWVGYPAIGYK